MKRTFGKDTLLISNLIALMIAVVLCFSLTLSWFTDTESINRDVGDPNIDFKFYKLSNDEEITPSNGFYWDSSNTDGVYIKFYNTNVTNLVVRYRLSIEWGTIEDEEFVRDYNKPDSEAFLYPYIGTSSNTFSTSWNKGYVNTTNSDIVPSVMTQEQYNTLMANSRTYYYYNTLITEGVNNINNTTVKLFDKLELGNNAYSGLTAKVVIRAEVDFASTQTIGVVENSVLTQAGKWSPIESGVRQDGAQVAWINSIKTQMTTAGITE